MSILNPLKKGQVVRALKGRDLGKVQIVMDILDSSYVMVVDGKRRTVSNPKKKKVKHLQPFNQEIELKDLSNKTIRKVIASFECNKRRK